MFEAVIFDMDGVLIESEPVWQAEERKAIEKVCGFDITPEMQNQTFGLNTGEVIMHWYQHKPWKNLDAEALTQDIYTRVLDYFSVNGLPAKGIPGILDVFKSKHIPLGVASSSPQKLIDAILDKLRIRQYFDIAYSSDNEALGKPHPAVYIHACRALGAQPAQCLAFEDSINGLIAAKAARMTTVAIPPADKWDHRGYAIADMKIKSLEDFNESHIKKLKTNNHYA